MSDIAIQIENLSKHYRLGEIGTGTISYDLNRWWAKTRGKEDPFSKIDIHPSPSTSTNKDHLWALKDVNLEVKQGEILGIIGKNGAGKSTLLKLLSKVSKPSAGNIKLNGRIAALLEVGTGFHPELTGRENIFLNGAILGMTKSEIKRKFDEIVNFSGVERHIDTPVKRYSSGMYVRLAFAVAAHLESEILIVDEVLAVGDAEFQKKCMGKMGDISKGEGRTILFVSHNMAAIENLCSKALLLANGSVFSTGETKKTISDYLFLNTSATKNNEISNIADRKGNGFLKFTKIALIDNQTGIEGKNIQCGANIKFRLFFERKETQVKDLIIAMAINDQFDQRLAYLSSEILNQKLELLQPDQTYIDFIVDKIPLNTGRYNLTLFCSVNDVILDWVQNAFYFDIVNGDFYSTGKTVQEGNGSILLNYKIKL